MPSESKSDCTKSLEKKGQKSIPANKYGKEQNNRFKDSAKEPNELTPKTWMEMVSSYHLIKFIFVMVAIIRKMVACIELG